MAVYLLFIFVSVGCIDLDDLGSLHRRINKGSIENMERKIMMNKRMRKKYHYHELALALDSVCKTIDKLETEMLLLRKEVEAHDKYIADDRYLASQNTQTINDKFQKIETDIEVLGCRYHELAQKKNGIEKQVANSNTKKSWFSRK